VAQNQDSLKYEIKIKAMVVPVFAVDSKGNPVYDLKEEELQLYVNGKPFKILQFNRYGFEFEEKIEEPVKRLTVKEKPEKVVKKPERYLFIIIDSIFNSLAGLRRSKEIAVGLVESASQGDAFIILENNPGGGLKYVIGPEKNKKKLIGQIEKIKQLPVTRMKLRNPKRKGHFFSADKRHLRQKNTYFFNPEKNRKDKEDEKLRYITDMKYFSKVLAEFKYALKFITRPKIVFLISEGISKGAFIEVASLNPDGESSEFNTQNFYFEYLRNVSKAINDGGSVIYSINPRRLDVSDDDYTEGDDSLKFMAAESGGQYFRGLDTQKIVKRIKKSTAAYYELFFYPGTESTAKMRIKIKCKRKGVRVHSINYSEQEKSYAEMPKIQKELFAFNLITGGNWSRVVAKVEKLKYKKMKRKKAVGENIRNIEVTIPRTMKGHVVDIFVLMVNPETLKADIDMKSQTVDERIEIGVKIEKGKKSFVVIIDPATVYCIYNLIRK
jgi:VWFA-related protein